MINVLDVRLTFEYYLSLIFDRNNSWPNFSYFLVEFQINPNSFSLINKKIKIKNSLTFLAKKMSINTLGSLNKSTSPL